MPRSHSLLLFVLSLALLLPGCSTPYRPAVVVRDSAPFPGIAGVIAANKPQAVDVILVHGICTHDAAWAAAAIDRVAGIVETHAPPPVSQTTAAAAPGNGIQLVERTYAVAGGTVRFHALVWSPLTSRLKRQLDYDATGTPTDCAHDEVCKPKRAKLNGVVKDWLLNDCLSDALIYEGDSHETMRDAMVDTVSQVLEANPDDGGTLVVVAESLGSKMLFDALSSMLESNQPRTQALGRQAARRLGLVFMAGNQLPILGLAEQTLVARAMPAQDTLQRFLELRRRQPSPRAGGIARLGLVAFTDPNDVLSYRLLPARYAAPDVAVADVLVSNGRTWLGLFENPLTAHLDYLANPDVGALIACGYPAQAGCR
jgi:hypothetical protein